MLLQKTTLPKIVLLLNVCCGSILFVKKFKNISYSFCEELKTTNDAFPQIKTGKTRKAVKKTMFL